MRNADSNRQQKSVKSSWTYKRLVRVALCAALLPSFAAAEETSTAPLPPPLVNGDPSLEEEVVITPRSDERVKEYRMNNQLFMIEIIPTKGPSYYLLDTDGDGVLETRRYNVEPDVTIPRWVILRWK